MSEPVHAHDSADKGGRARRYAQQGVKAVGLTAAGLAGGVILESQARLSRKLPLPERRNRVQAALHAIRKRLS
jgi:hypothetical protein